MKKDFTKSFSKLPKGVANFFEKQEVFLENLSKGKNVHVSRVFYHRKICWYINFLHKFLEKSHSNYPGLSNER